MTRVPIFRVMKSRYVRTRLQIKLKIVACRGATNERTTEGLMCGGPLRAVRAEEGNPRPGLS